MQDPDITVKHSVAVAGQWSTDLDARAIMLDQLSVLDDMTTGFIQRKVR